MNITPYANQVKIRALRTKQRRLNQLMKGNRVQVVIYTKSNCINCVSAKNLLREHQIGHIEIDVERNPDVLKRLLEQYPDARQMPQITVNDQRIGGLEGLKKYLPQILAMKDDWK